MPDTTWAFEDVAAVPTRKTAPRHRGVVRATHALTVACFLALLVSGAEIIASHPRFYWGENGTVATPPLFTIPIPSSRAMVPTGYGYVLPDQNGWSRYLHFESAWVLVFTGLLYVMWGLGSGHFADNLVPAKGDRSWRALRDVAANHLQLKRSPAAERYNPLQRVTYLAVVFVLFPLVIWTGLAMSPAVTSAFPSTVVLLGGRQSARTLHFFISIALVVFLIVHVVMIWLAGFTRSVAAMFAGGTSGSEAQ